MLMIRRADRGYCERCHLVGDTFAVEGDDGHQRLICPACLRAIEPDRCIPEPFGKTMIRATGEQARQWGSDFSTMTETPFFAP